MPSWAIWCDMEVQWQRSAQMEVIDSMPPACFILAQLEIFWQLAKRALPLYVGITGIYNFDGM